MFLNEKLRGHWNLCHRQMLAKAFSCRKEARLQHEENSRLLWTHLKWTDAKWKTSVLRWIKIWNPVGGKGEQQFGHFIGTSEYNFCYILHHICCCFMNMFVLIQSQLCVNDLHPGWVNESTPCPDLKTLPHWWRTEASDLLGVLASLSAPPPCFP